MNPEKGQQVKCVMQSGIVIEGIVESWENQVVLKSLDGQSLIIIHRPEQDIIFTKIALAQKSMEITNEPTTPQKQIKEKLEEVRTIEDPILKDKSINELRKMVVAQEREIIIKKTKEHFGTAGSAKLTRYTTPYMPKVLPNTPASQVPDEHPPSAYKPGKIPKNNID